jgi:hypothetical protein
MVQFSAIAYSPRLVPPQWRLCLLLQGWGPVDGPSPELTWIKNWQVSLR